jgi:hypothetical protein
LHWAHWASSGLKNTVIIGSALLTLNEIQGRAEKVIFRRLIKNARMQVELCEIPFYGGARNPEE